jgi:hypothetical protein
MSRGEQLEELVLEMLERFGVLSDGTPLDDDATPQDVADSLAGIEGYSLQFNQHTYVILPEDVQELFLLMASAIYADNAYDGEEDEEDDEFSGGPVYEFELDTRPVRDAKEDEEDS